MAYVLTASGRARGRRGSGRAQHGSRYPPSPVALGTAFANTLYQPDPDRTYAWHEKLLRRARPQEAKSSIRRQRARQLLQRSFLRQNPRLALHPSRRDALPLGACSIARRPNQLLERRRACWGPLEWKPYSYDGYGIDWPISYEEMAPWYSKTELLVGVSGGKAGQMTGTPDGEFMPPQGYTCNHAIITAAVKKMGYITTREPHAIITQDHNGRPQCHYCGRCGQGCDSGAKFTSVGALLPVAQATGRMTVFTNAIVREVTVDSSGRASGVSFIDRYTFQENAVRGRQVVLSAGSIETARILLNSKSNLFPNGLANSSGQVGRWLVEDTACSVSGELPQLEGREIVNEDGYQGDVMIHPFANIDEKTRSKDYLRRYIMRSNGGFAMGGGGGGGVMFGAGIKDASRRVAGSGVNITGAGCGLEDPNNFMELDPNVKDAWGISVARIHLKHGPTQEGMARDMVKRGIEIIEAAGGKVSRYSAGPAVPGANVHEQGTCRMGDDSKKFVTNRWGRTHDVPNLTLADGSIHCTSGITNPTMTILSLTMRNAAHLTEDVRKGNT